MFAIAISTGLGPSKIAATLLPGCSAEDWLYQSIAGLDVDPDRVARLYHASNAGPWQTANIIPPLLRFLNKLEDYGLHTARWELSGISEPFKPVDGPISVATNGASDSLGTSVEKALEHEKHFSYQSQLDDTSIHIRHQMCWSFRVQLKHEPCASHSIAELAQTRPVIVPYLGIVAERSFNNLRCISMGMCCDPGHLHHLSAPQARGHLFFRKHLSWTLVSRARTLTAKSSSIIPWDA
jgi:hypothetical protein